MAKTERCCNQYETLSNFKGINIKFYSISKLFGSY